MQHKEIVDEFNFYWKFDEEEYAPEIAQLGAKYGIDFNSDEKYMGRLHRSMKEKGYEIFESGRFNLELFQYIVKEYFEKRDKEEDKESKLFGDDYTEEGEGVMGMLMEALGLGETGSKYLWGVAGGAVLITFIVLLGFFFMHASGFSSVAGL